MPLKVTFSGGICGLLTGLLHGLTPSATLTSRCFSSKFVPRTKGKSMRPPVSVWLTSVEPGGYLKLNEYLLFTYVCQAVVSVPETRMSTHQDFVPPVPIPNRTPLAFWNLQ